MITRRRLVVGLGTLAAGIAFSGRWARSASPVSVDEVDLGAAAPSPVPTLLAPVPITFALSHLGARWLGDEDTEIELRWRPAESAWGDWRRLAVSPDLGDPANGVWYSGLLVASQASEVQARVVRGVARRVTLITIDASDGTGRTSEERPESTEPSRSADTGSSPPRPPEVVSRRHWRADESRRKGEPKFSSVSRISVHHTTTPNDDPDPAATVRAIYAYHTQANGWDDIGYNFLIDADGRIYEGRLAREYGPGETPTGEDSEGHGVIGAHTLGNNPGTIGVALLGDFTTDRPSSAALNALERLLAWKADRHRIDPLGTTAWSTGTRPTIIGHRDAGATSCPGDQLFAALPGVRRGVADRLVAPASGAAAAGYWLLGRDGAVVAFGDVDEPPPPDGPPAAPAIALVATPSGKGYWVLAEDGGVVPSGDARSFGSTRGLSLNGPPIALAATPTGRGYWIGARDGGVFAFGDARFFGSAGGLRLRQPVVGLAGTPTGRGYWLVAADGGVFAFGDARFFGSGGDARWTAPVVALAARPQGDGYWLLTADGGVVPYGAARSFGDLPSQRIRRAARSVRVCTTPTGAGYYVLATDGGVFAFGDARFFGSSPGRRDSASAVDLAVATKDGGTGTEEPRPH